MIFVALFKLQWQNGMKCNTKSVILMNTIRYMIYRVKIVDSNIYIYNKNSGKKEMSNDQKNSKYFGEIKQCWKLSTRILVC